MKATNMTFDRPLFQGSIFRWRILVVKTLWYLWILVSSNILPLLTFISIGWSCWSKTLGAYCLPLPGQRALPCSPSTLLQENKTLYIKHKHNQTEHQWISTCMTVSTSINKYKFINNNRHDRQTTKHQQASMVTSIYCYILYTSILSLSLSTWSHWY